MIIVLLLKSSTYTCNEFISTVIKNKNIYIKVAKLKKW